VVERRARHGLATEALGDGGVARELRLQHLDRDLAVEERVGPEPHLGHAATRDLSLEPVPPGDDGGAVGLLGSRRGHHRRPRR
jgi:hypothetical protein